MNYPRKNPIYWKKVCTFQSNQIKFENLKSLPPLEKIHHSSINNLISEETKSQIKAHILYLANSYFYNHKPSPRILRQHRVWRNLRKNKDIIITKPNKGNGVVILNRKLYDNAIQEITSDTSKFEKLTENPTLKREASLQRFLRKLKQKYFNQNEYDKLYPSGSAPARIYGTPKMHKFSCRDSFPNLRPIVSCIGTFNYNLALFFAIFFHPYYLIITLAKILFLLFLKLRMQIFPENFLFPTM